MLHSGHYKQDLPITIAMFFRRISAAIIAVASLRGLMVVYGASLDDAYMALLVIVGLLSLMLIPGKTNEQQSDLRFWNTIISVCGKWLILFAILLSLGYATKVSSIYSRKLLFTWLIVTPLFISLFQILIDDILSRIFRSATRTRRFVIAGANEIGRSLAEKISANPSFGMSFQGYFDDRGLDRLGNTEQRQLLGGLQDLPDFVRKHGTELVYVALPMRNIQRVSELLDEIHDTTASIYYVPDIFVFDLIQCRTADIDGLPVIALCETPIHGTRGVRKRMSDVIISSLVLTTLSPLLLMIAIGVKLTTKGSVIFTQRRYGLDGREIEIYKFRSMTVSEDSDTVNQASRNDARVTRFGSFLRRYSLDELPQFFNVLQGRMSVVGPRPHAVAHNEEYRRVIKGYMFRHKVTPGITGLAQVRGLRGGTKTVDDMQRRVESDLEYVRKWSLSLDAKIILKTMFIVFRDKSAY
jgi:putative colanic acid biosynthesis UDP-glucose lipid carrier transferase